MTVISSLGFSQERPAKLRGTPFPAVKEKTVLFRRKATLWAVSLVLAPALAVLGATPVLAAPSSVDRARVELQRLDEEAGRIEEEWSQARMQLQEGAKRVEALATDIAAQQIRVESLAGQAREVALVQFRSRGIDTTTALFVSGDADSFLSELSTANKVAENMNAVVQEYQAQEANLTDLRRAADAEVAALTARERHMADLDAQADRKVDEAAAVLQRLTAAERAAVTRDDSGASADQSRAVDAVKTVYSAGGGDPRALKAVAYAVSKVGRTQYVWGAAGPNSFDCSGLTLASYASAGVSLPHSSSAQFGTGKAVAKADLRPGDLLFWYSPVHHVGIYIGNGNFVHARNTTVDIVLQPLSSYPAPYSGARRVVG